MNKKQLFLIILILWYSQCFSWMSFPIESTMYGWISHILEFFLLLAYFAKRKSASYTFSRPVMCVMLIPFLSIISAVWMNGQTFMKGFVALTSQFTFILYFLFHFLIIPFYLSNLSKLSNAFPVPKATHDTASSAIITFIPVFSCKSLSNPSIKHPPPVI